MRDPWFHFFVRDWQSDSSLRSVSMEARGLWIEYLCIMAQAEPRGHLMVNGQIPTSEGKARLTGGTVAAVERAERELIDMGVCSLSDSGAIISRRMIRDEAKRQEFSKHGKKGAAARYSHPSTPPPPPPPEEEKKNTIPTPIPIPTKGNGLPHSLPHGLPLTQPDERERGIPFVATEEHTLSEIVAGIKGCRQEFKRYHDQSILNCLRDEPDRRKLVMAVNACLATWGDDASQCPASLPATLRANIAKNHKDDAPRSRLT